MKSNGLANTKWPAVPPDCNDPEPPSMQHGCSQHKELPHSHAGGNWQEILSINVLKEIRTNVCVSVSGRGGKLSTDQVASCAPLLTAINVPLIHPYSSGFWQNCQMSVHIGLLPCSLWGNWGMGRQWTFPRHNSKFISDMYVVCLCSW